MDYNQTRFVFVVGLIGVVFGIIGLVEPGAPPYVRVIGWVLLGAGLPLLCIAMWWTKVLAERASSWRRGGSE